MYLRQLLGVFLLLLLGKLFFFSALLCLAVFHFVFGGPKNIAGQENSRTTKDDWVSVCVGNLCHPNLDHGYSLVDTHNLHSLRLPRKTKEQAEVSATPPPALTHCWCEINTDDQERCHQRNSKRERKIEKFYKKWEKGLAQSEEWSGRPKKVKQTSIKKNNETAKCYPHHPAWPRYCCCCFFSCCLAGPPDDLRPKSPIPWSNMK